MFINAKQITELQASKIYIKYLNLDISNNLFDSPEESSPIDVIYTPKSFKFQITCFDGGSNQLYKYKRYSFKHELDKMIDQFIIEPINKKFEKYKGVGVSDIILLLHYIQIPGTKEMFQKDIQYRKSEINNISIKSGFKSIYLVFDIDDSVIEIYKKSCASL